MKVLCEVLLEKEEQDINDSEPVMEKKKYWLLHFGLKADIIDMGDGRMVGLNYTVCICQDCDTGDLRCYLPESLRIIGEEIKK